MDLKQLRTFLEVADEGSLTRAAESLHVAQPALGRQIKQLEDEFGGALFDRHGRGMTLTETGRLLADRAQSILRLVEDARAELSAAPNAVAGAVTLGVPPTVGEALGGRLIERFLRLHPSVVVRIVPAFSGYLYDMLRRGEVDLAVVYESAEARQIRSEPLLEENLRLVGAPHLMADLGGVVRFEQLAGKPLILPGPRQGSRMLFERAAQTAGVDLRVIVEADGLQTLKDLAMRGLGYTVLPTVTVRPELENGTLLSAELSKPELKRRLILARSVLRPASNAVRIFAETLKAETADMVREGVWDGNLAG